MSSAEPRAWVVDASVALIAPDLVLVELLNAGWKAQRQGAISEEQFLAIGELAPTLFSELVPAAGSTAAAQGAASSAGGGSGDGGALMATIHRHAP